MRLALIRAKYDPFGGAERFVETAAAALADQGVALTILTRNWPANARAGIHHTIIDPPHLNSTARDRGFAKAVCAFLQTEKFDLVQSHERIACCDVYRAGDGVHAEWIAQRQRVVGNLKRLEMALSPHHRYLLRAERELFTAPRLRAVICNSHMVRDEIMRHFGTDAGRLHVIYSGVDSQKFHPGLVDQFRLPTRAQLGIPPHAQVALFVGSGFERKGAAAFIATVAGISGMQGIVVGKDKRLNAAKQSAAAKGCAGRIHFTGGVDDVRPYYAAADVLILPTLYDPFPNVCLEALACGLPVITSTKSGAAELIRNGENGYVTDALDIPAMRIALSRVLAAPPMRVAARETILPYTPESMASQYVALYRKLLGLGEHVK
jgi:UDP-glucose:(heptosyl)LPS alpha-1,3-glucosyltransferase